MSSTKSSHFFDPLPLNNCLFAVGQQDARTFLLLLSHTAIPNHLHHPPLHFLWSRLTVWKKSPTHSLGRDHYDCCVWTGLCSVLSDWTVCYCTLVVTKEWQIRCGRISDEEDWIYTEGPYFTDYIDDHIIYATWPSVFLRTWIFHYGEPLLMTRRLLQQDELQIQRFYRYVTGRWCLSKLLLQVHSWFWKQ